MAEAADGLTDAPAAHGYGPLASAPIKKAVNKTKAVKKPKPVIVVQKKLSPEEKAAKEAKEKAEAAKKKAEEDEQNKQLEKMQALMEKFDESDREKAKEHNNNYFERNKQPAAEHMSFAEAAGFADPDPSEANMEKSAKKTILKDLLSQFPIG